MPVRRPDVIRLVTAASLSALVPLSAAQARVAVFLFFPPPPTPPPPVVVVRPQVLQWPGPLARDTLPLHPARPPAPRCYTAVAMCPLEPSGVPGGPCSCPSENGRVAGRALIPPSRKLG
jgi:hypothetical protein